MKKIVYDIVIVAGVTIAILFMAAFQPGTNAIISSVNSSINGTAFPTMAAAVNSYPIYSWLIPGLVGLILFVYNHKFSK
jgi:hypothetical protein